MWNVQEQEERDFRVSSEAEVDAYEANLAGYERKDQAWILSDRDVWYANPYYKGPPQRHPEDYDYEEDEVSAEPTSTPVGALWVADEADEDIPF